MTRPALSTHDSDGSPAPVRWAIVGTGSIAATFAADIAHAGNARLAAVCSRNMETAQIFASRFAGAECFDDLARLSASPDIDAVYLATPNDSHFEQAKRLLGNGKAVLVEKPLVISPGDARTLQDLAGSTGTFVMEALWTAFLPALAQVRTLLAEGTLGSVTAIEAQLSYEKPADPQSRFFSPQRGGGSLLDLGIYPLALTLNLFGEPASAAGQWRSAPSGVDMSAEVELFYPEFTATLSCGFDRNGANRFTIHGTEGSLVIAAPFLQAKRVFVVKNRLAQLVLAPKGRLAGRLGDRLAPSLPGVSAIESGYPGHGLQFEIEAVGDAIRNGWGEHPLMPLSASVAALDIIEAVRSQPPLD